MITRSLTPTRLVAALLAAGIVGGAGASLFNARHVQAAQQAPTASSTTTAAIAAPDFSQIAARYGASVVNISVTGTTKVADMSGGDGTSGPQSGDPMLEFFRRHRGAFLITLTIIIIICFSVWGVPSRERDHQRRAQVTDLAMTIGGRDYTIGDVERAQRSLQFSQ